MILRAGVRETVLVLILASAARMRAAQEVAGPDRWVPPPGSANAVAPDPARSPVPPAPSARLKPSRVLATRISSVFPIWNPPPAKPAEKFTAPDPKVVKMAPLIVWGTRIPSSETEVLTERGRLELAEKRYISPLYRVTFGPLSQLAAYYLNFLTILGGWHPNEAEAMTLYRQDERLERLRELDALTRLEMFGDARDAKEFQRLRFEARLLPP
jgi:hypothetical protein